MQSFLAAVPLQGAAIAVVGVGEEAEAKLRLLAASPARLWWFGDGLGAAHQVRLPQAQIVARWPRPDDLTGFKLVFIAHDDLDAVDAWAAAARAGGAWVNVVDQPARCDFTTPALIDRDGLVIGVATGGRSPALAQYVRDLIARTLPPSFADLARLLGEARAAVAAALPDPAARKGFWRTLVAGPATDHALGGDLPAAEAALMLALREASERPGTGEGAR